MSRDGLSGARILIAPDSGPGVGGGHVLRCLSLAASLEEAGARCAFCVGPAGRDLLARFGGGGYLAHPELEGALGEGRPDLLVLDSYRTAYLDEKRMAGLARRLLVLDDLADRPHPADILVDAGFGRSEGDYAALLPAGALRLLGPDYALLRPEFAARREEALWRTHPDEPRRIVVSLGLSDLADLPARVYAALRRRSRSVRIDLVVPNGARGRGRLEEAAEGDARLQLHADADMAALLAACDAAVGAGGVSLWERACLGRPSVTLVVADNQAPMAAALEAAGAHIRVEARRPRPARRPSASAAGAAPPPRDPSAAEIDSRLEEAIARLFDRRVRESLSAASSRLCDGLGAPRVAAAAAGVLV